MSDHPLTSRTGFIGIHLRTLQKANGLVNEYHFIIDSIFDKILFLRILSVKCSNKRPNFSVFHMILEMKTYRHLHLSIFYECMPQKKSFEEVLGVVGRNECITQA